MQLQANSINDADSEGIQKVEQTAPPWHVSASWTFEFSTCLVVRIEIADCAGVGAGVFGALDARVEQEVPKESKILGINAE